MNSNELRKLSNNYRELEGYANAYEHRRIFAVQNFESLLNLALRQYDDIDSAKREVKKTTISDYYPAGGFDREPCPKCLESCGALEEVGNMITDLFAILGNENIHTKREERALSILKECKTITDKY